MNESTVADLRAALVANDKLQKEIAEKATAQIKHRKEVQRQLDEAERDLLEQQKVATEERVRLYKQLNNPDNKEVYMVVLYYPTYGDHGRTPLFLSKVRENYPEVAEELLKRNYILVEKDLLEELKTYPGYQPPGGIGHEVFSAWMVQDNDQSVMVEYRLHLRRS